MDRKKAVVQATYHVSISGNDSHPGTETRPFATLERTQDAVRSVNQAMTGDIVIILRGGIHAMRKPLAFGPGDSGTNGYDVVYRSYPGEKAAISGGR